MINDRQVDVSVIIVNYNVKHFAEQCLRSIYAASDGLNVEIFLVDNSSTDGSVEYLRSAFPQVFYIECPENYGFGRANNIAMTRSVGEYILILNPDTLIGEDSLRAMVDYLNSRPHAGAAGPMILTRYGGYDRLSKRGFPTPWVSFCRLSGLSRLFGKSRLFGRYDMQYLDPEEPASIDSLVGACMFIRREAYNAVGGFDEDYFMYGEDIDLCYRIKKAGWEIHYAPVTRIVHFQGESTKRSNIDRDKAFYGSMHLFVDKHFRSTYTFFGHWLIDLGIILARTAAKIARIRKRIVGPVIDWIGLWGVMAVGRLIRWGSVGLTLSVGFALAIQSTVWILCFAAMGAYGRKRVQIMPLALGIILGFFINSSFTYFFKQFAYSRFVTLFGLVFGGLFVWGWRNALYRLKFTRSWMKFYQRRALIVGVGKIGREVARKLNLPKQQPYIPVGFIDPQEKTVGSLIEGLPVLGSEVDLARLIEQEEIEEILFAFDDTDYNRILKIVSEIGEHSKVNFKVISSDAAVDIDDHIPFLSFDYLTPRGIGKSLRKLTTLVLKG